MTPARITWTVSHLHLEPHHAVLEVGAAPGVAAELVCERLTTGRMVAVDRSAGGAERIRARNRRHLDDGRLLVVHASLADLDLDGERFDRIFAVNVNVFWTTPAERELAVIDRLLAPHGIVVLAYSAPDGRHDHRLDTVEAHLTEAGFTSHDRIVGADSALVIARRSPGAGLR